MTYIVPYRYYYFRPHLNILISKKKVLLVTFRQQDKLLGDTGTLLISLSLNLEAGT
jgi:hypothetical protein